MRRRGPFWSSVLFVSGVVLSACHPGGTPATTTTGAPLCATDPGPAPLRRITRFEYGRALSDLTGADPAIAQNLPPDEETMDFDDIASAFSVSSLHADRYLQSAEQAATALAGNAALLAGFGGCDPTGGDLGCVAAFVNAFGRRAWRRALTADEQQAMLQLYTATAAPAPADGVTGVVTAMLQAPQFLYRPEAAGATATSSQALDGYGLATRLAFMLTGAPPDEPLLQAAEQGDLATEAGLLAQTDRLLAMDRAAELFVHFASEWWEVEPVTGIDKNRSLYRNWTDATPGALAAQTSPFLTDAWNSGPTLASLLTDSTGGAGMLTQAAFLAVHAKADQTSPVLRGKFVRAQLFCTPPPPPPPTIVVAPPVVDPRLPTRQRFAQHTADPFCAGCHTLMDPIGFAFENWDATGVWRDTDADQPVDATGSLTGTDVDGDLDGVPSLATKLAASAQVATCAATQWFRYAFGRSEQSNGDLCTISALAATLSGPGGDFKKMVRRTVQTAAFRNLPPEAQP
jgi:hypothetical protein